MQHQYPSSLAKVMEAAHCCFIWTTNYYRVCCMWFLFKAETISVGLLWACICNCMEFCVDRCWHFSKKLTLISLTKLGQKVDYDREKFGRVMISTCEKSRQVRSCRVSINDYLPECRTACENCRGMRLLRGKRVGFTKVPGTKFRT